jgi:hypothetical protein
VNLSLYSPINKSITAAYSSNDIKDEQKCINKNKRIYSVKFGFSQKAALKDLEGRRFPTPVLGRPLFLVPCGFHSSDAL